MLQISQTENPTCSATIDQIRLRRATTLPVEFQNVSSSGFHSEIQVGFCSLTGDSFLRLYRPSGVIETACERHGGAPPGEPDLAKPQIRMIGFDGRLQWRQH